MTIRLALIGMGIAGQARQRACSTLDNVELAATVSRRSDHGSHTLQAVLNDPKITALAISTENTQHASLTRQCLESDKHVLCDYPLTLSHSEASALFDLAKKRNRVLHTEHIGLLADDHLQFKKQISTLGKLQRAEYLFQGGWNNKLADTSRGGPYPFLSISRLMQIVDWFGDFDVESHACEKTEKGFRLHLHLQLSQGGKIAFTEERIEGLTRRRSFQGIFAKGKLNWKTGSMGGNLFAKDLAWFRDRVSKNKACYYDETLMLKVIQRLEKISNESSLTIRAHL